jgi:hypothetical protein
VKANTAEKAFNETIVGILLMSCLGGP